MNPSDIYAETLSRLVPLHRESLSPERQADYDALTRPSPGGLNLAGLTGPGGLWMRCPALRKPMGEVNRMLRSGCDLDPRLVEVAILAAAREMDSEFEWTMHKPVALEKGVARQTIEIIRHRRELAGVPEEEAILIRLARESIGAHRVEPECYARGIALFGEEKLLYYAALIACYAMTATMLAVVDQRLPEGKRPLL
jgi:4-carboxymuconolactone decarboxylase